MEVKLPYELDSSRWIGWYFVSVLSFQTIGWGSLVAAAHHSALGLQSRIIRTVHVSAFPSPFRTVCKMKLTSRYNVIRDPESPCRIRRLHVSHSVGVCLRNDISITTVSCYLRLQFPWETRSSRHLTSLPPLFHRRHHFITLPSPLNLSSLLLHLLRSLIFPVILSLKFQPSLFSFYSHRRGPNVLFHQTAQTQRGRGNC